MREKITAKDTILEGQAIRIANLEQSDKAIIAAVQNQAMIQKVTDSYHDFLLVDEMGKRSHAKATKTFREMLEASNGKKPVAK